MFKTTLWRSIFLRIEPLKPLSNEIDTSKYVGKILLSQAGNKDNFNLH